MWRQTLQRLSLLRPTLSQQIQRNFGVSAIATQKAAALDPVQQLFVNKIREYKSKSAGGKLVDANKETEDQLKEMLGNLERAYEAKGVDMTKFPTFNFTEPTLEWPGPSEEQRAKILEAIAAAELQEAQEAEAKEV